MNIAHISHAVLLVFCCSLPGSVLAQDTAEKTGSNTRKTEFTPEETEKINSRVNALSDQLKSPFCPGKTLTTCTSPDALNLRIRIKQMMVDGWTDDQIVKQLNEEFASKLDNPEQPDATVLIYVLPFILGSLAVLVIFWSWKKGHKESDRGVSDALNVSEDAPANDQSSEEREERLAKLRERIRTDD